MSASDTFAFDNSYARLPGRFFAALAPTRVAAPRLLRLNRALAAELGLDADRLENGGAAIFAGNEIPAGAEPIALAYAGHQFGHFVPSLGDGRALLLGEVIDRHGGRRDIQLKGSGPTPFSRRGDGRAAIGPVLREYLIGEAMAALGIPTSRALAAAATGEPVFRDSALPGAVLTRVAASHLRIGSFQYFAARQDGEAVATLLDYAITRHYPASADADNPALALFRAVAAAQARLIAQWLLVGFVHGVMNTDNMTISGETIDYGPCAFIDAYDPDAVFSSIDQFGRYAYGQQPRIGQWNLARLAECLLPLFSPDEHTALAMAQEALDAFVQSFETAYQAGLLRKIGITAARDGDVALGRSLLAAMAADKADYTLTFRRLAEGGDLAALFADRAAIEDWLGRWRARLADEPPGQPQAVMRAANPAVIPRNHQVEAALAAAMKDDLAPFDRLLAAIGDPFTDRPTDDPFLQPPPASDQPYVTFCGT